MLRKPRDYLCIIEASRWKWQYKAEAKALKMVQSITAKQVTDFRLWPYKILGPVLLLHISEDLKKIRSVCLCVSTFTFHQSLDTYMVTPWGLICIMAKQQLKPHQKVLFLIA